MIEVPEGRQKKRPVKPKDKFDASQKQAPEEVSPHIGPYNHFCFKPKSHLFSPMNTSYPVSFVSHIEIGSISQIKRVLLC